jgi:hypothetical protein
MKISELLNWDIKDLGGRYPIWNHILDRLDFVPKIMQLLATVPSSYFPIFHYFLEKGASFYKCLGSTFKALHDQLI